MISKYIVFNQLNMIVILYLYGLGFNSKLINNYDNINTNKFN